MCGFSPMCTYVNMWYMNMILYEYYCIWIWLYMDMIAYEYDCMWMCFACLHRKMFQNKCVYVTSACCGCMFVNRGILMYAHTCTTCEIPISIIHSCRAWISRNVLIFALNNIEIATECERWNFKLSWIWIYFKIWKIDWYYHTYLKRNIIVLKNNSNLSNKSEKIKEPGSHTGDGCSGASSHLLKREPPEPKE